MRERLANILRRLWEDAREQRSAFLRLEAERAAFADARARHAAAEIDAALDRFAA